MKDIIKSTLALFFILGAFFIGKYSSIEENKTEIKELNKNISLYKKQITKNENAIRMMEFEITILKDSILNIKEKSGITNPKGEKYVKPKRN